MNINKEVKATNVSDKKILRQWEKVLAAIFILLYIIFSFSTGLIYDVTGMIVAAIFAAFVYIALDTLICSNLKGDNFVKPILPAIVLLLVAAAVINGLSQTEETDISSDISTDATVITTSAETITLRQVPAVSETTASKTLSESDNKLLQDEFVSAVKAAIDGDVGKDEKIISVFYKDKKMTIMVDLKNANIPAGLTVEDIARSRVSSITDDILKMSEYDDMWSEITIDFGDVGFVKNTKANIVDEGYGRFFDNFELKK